MPLKPVSASCRARLSDARVDEFVSLSIFRQVDIFIRGCYLRPGNDGLCPRVTEGCLGDMDEVTPSIKSALDVSFIEAFAVGQGPEHAVRSTLPFLLFSLTGSGVWHWGLIWV